MCIPDTLKAFFQAFGFLKIQYYDKRRDCHEMHRFSPSVEFQKKQYAHLLDSYGIPGMAYPVGSAFRENMDIYFHKNGNFYLFMGGGPVIQAGDSVDSFLDGLLGEEEQSWIYLRRVCSDEA